MAKARRGGPGRAAGVRHADAAEWGEEWLATGEPKREEVEDVLDNGKAGCVAPDGGAWAESKPGVEEVEDVLGREPVGMVEVGLAAGERVEGDGIAEGA